MATPSPTIVELAVRLAGGPVATARFCTRYEGRRVSYQAVQGWIAKNRVPADRCIALEMATGRKVRCSQLRPDVFGHPFAARVSESQSYESVDPWPE